MFDAGYRRALVDPTRTYPQSGPCRLGTVNGHPDGGRLSGLGVCAGHGIAGARAKRALRQQGDGLHLDVSRLARRKREHAGGLASDAREHWRAGDAQPHEQLRRALLR